MGVGISPHDFRSCAATAAAMHAGDQPHLGSALMQHTDPRTTEKHYNRASTMSAAMAFGDMIRGLKK